MFDKLCHSSYSSNKRAILWLNHWEIWEQASPWLQNGGEGEERTRIVLLCKEGEKLQATSNGTYMDGYSHPESMQLNWTKQAAEK